jgi:hypothetical protein
MLGLVFTFEDDPEHQPVLREQLATKQVQDAVCVAVNFVDGIHFEQITDASNPAPKFAVIFNELTLVDAFTARLMLALGPTGIRISSVRAIKEASSADEDVAA